MTDKFEMDIEDKSIIENIRKEQEEIGMAVSALMRLSEDKVTRQAYQKRQDEITLYNKRISNYKREIEEKDIALADKDAIIAELRSRLGEK